MKSNLDELHAALDYLCGTLQDIHVDIKWYEISEQWELMEMRLLERDLTLGSITAVSEKIMRLRNIIN